MATPSEEEEEQSLLFMPTWTIASVCTVFVVSCLIVERFVFYIGHVLRERKQNALLKALEKIKEELMLVGFISIALSVGQSSIAGICVPKKWMRTMLQCQNQTNDDKRETLERMLSTEEDPSSCPEDKVHFMHVEGVHQLHILLFVLVIVHVFYSFLIMFLGIWKVSQWKEWEKRSNAAASVHGALRLSKDTTFIKRHATGPWSKNVFLGYLAAFFQQFFKSVSETDYHTLRHGFIANHKLQDFNFHTYIVKSVEEDFKYVVGVSPYLWFFTILLILLNVEGWKINFLAPLLPLVMVLIVGTKLRYIITEMAIQFCEKNSVVAGIAGVKPTDDLFWFRKPHFILHLIHFILFQDAFQVTLHLWSAYTFRDEKQNCLAMHPYVVLVRLMFGIFAQVICGYVMLPIYAIVSQMGSEIKYESVIRDIENSDPSEQIMSQREGLVPITPGLNSHGQMQPLNVSMEKNSYGNGREEPDTASAEEIQEGPDNNTGKFEKRASFIQKLGIGSQGSSYQSL